jgi:hypothetical protein
VSKHRAPAPKRGLLTSARSERGQRESRYVGARVAPRRSPFTAVRGSVVMTSAAAAATGVVVSGGVLLADTTLPAAAGDLGAVSAVTMQGSAANSGAETAEREEIVSRSDRRTAADPAKEAALAASDSPGAAHTESLSDEDPRIIGQALLPEFGFGADQFTCLDSLYASESGWRWNADNPNSSAYGIPQALPGSKMSSAGADWATNPTTQIRWGLGYIADRYGTPCGAWSFKQGHGWY